MERLRGFKDKNLIKVVTGIRRCGKSTLLEMFREELIADGVPESRIVTVNFEDFDFAHLKDPAALHAYVKERLAEGEMTYIFLDEIQNVKDFPLVLDSLYIKKNTDIYVTGSNAYMLSGEIATLISGRYVEIRVLPFSFKEYLDSVGKEGGLSAKYLEYIKTSSFPYASELRGNSTALLDYLNGIYSTVLLKDIVGRYGIADTMMLESVIRFIFDNIGSELSTKRISNIMTSDGRKIDTKTVEKYLSALMESFILYKAGRFDIKGGQYLKTLEKYYVVDIGLRRLLLGEKGMDVGHILENIVYLELIRRGFKVYVGKSGSYEVDFVASDSSGVSYYQVAASVRDNLTLERELRPLENIKDHRPKYLLTLDEDPNADYGGIMKINALDFLLS